MGSINLNNYEAFLLDHFEGHLSHELTLELKSFLITHPELEIDLNDLDLPVFSKEEIFPDFKKDLLKTENDFPNEELLNYIEGNLSITDKLDFEARLDSDSELAKDLVSFKKTILSPETDQVFENKQELKKSEDELALNSMFISYAEGTRSSEEKTEFEKQLSALVQITKLTADTSIIYPDKESLKKEARVVVLFNYRTVMTVAAAILLLIGLVVIFRNGNEKSVTPEFANNGKKNPVISSDSLVKNNIKEVKKEILPENTNDLVADRSNKIKNKAFVNIDSSFVIKNEEKNMANNNLPEENKIPKEIIKISNDTTGLANNNTNTNNPTKEVNAQKPGAIRYTNMDALAIATDNDEAKTTPEKKWFLETCGKIGKKHEWLRCKSC